jgi:alkaline phosphatase
MLRSSFPVLAVAPLALIAAAALISRPGHPVSHGDYLHDLQSRAIENGRSDVGYWGTVPEEYAAWSSHSNRLIPVYTFGTRGAGKGIDLTDYSGINSLQKAALAAGKKHIILVVFDGMDWDTTRAAAIYYSRKVAYTSGRGTGLHFQDYTAGETTQFGYMVTSPYEEGTAIDVNTQKVMKGGFQHGGYDPHRGGPDPWTHSSDLPYLIGKPENEPDSHAYTDSSSSATSLTTGIKTYNGAINVDPTGAPVATIAHLAQDDGYAVGAVSSVPFCHATPAAAYAHNIDRDDYQDLSRDLIGRPSIMHPDKPLSGLDVVIGAGYGITSIDDRKKQGENYVPGNRGLADADLHAIDVRSGGKYVVAMREPGVRGVDTLRKGAEEAAHDGKRFLGIFGDAKTGHLPFQTADGDFNPAPGRQGKAESYKPEDISENPTLADMAVAALDVLDRNPKGFWLMVEAGDVDWANHDNNLDNSIGAVKSGDDAVKAITDWVEKHSNWQETVLIVTADHGHYLHLAQPGALIPPTHAQNRDSAR